MICVEGVDRKLLVGVAVYWAGIYSYCTRFVV